MKNCENNCDNFTGNCPNVSFYADGTQRQWHTEVKCNGCGRKYMWSLSWNGSKDGLFNCGCEKGEALDLEIKRIREDKII